MLPKNATNSGTLSEDYGLEKVNLEEENSSNDLSKEDINEESDNDEDELVKTNFHAI